MHKDKAQANAFVLFGFFVVSVFALMAFRVSWEFASLLILAVLVFLIAFIKTDFALVILILSMLLSPEFRAGGIEDRAILIRGDDLFIVVICMGWMARMAVRKELGLLKWTPLNKPIMLYMMTCVVSTLIGIIWGDTSPRRAVFYLLKYFEYYFLFFLVVNNLKNVRQAKMYVGVILLTAFIVSLITAAQIPSGQRLSAPFESEGGEPNSFSGYLLLMLGLILGFLMYPGMGSRLMYAGFLGLVILPFLFTLSRGGWLGFFPMVMTFIVLSKRYRFQLIMGTLVLILCLPFILPKQVFHRISETFEPERAVKVMGKRYGVSESAMARVDAWKIGFRRLYEKPFLGHGVPTGSVVDNQFMRVVAETGTVGLICYLWILVSVFKQGTRLFREYSGDLFCRGLAAGFLGGYIGLLFHSMSAASFIIIRIMEPFWFLAGVIVALPALKQQETGE